MSTNIHYAYHWLLHGDADAFSVSSLAARSISIIIDERDCASTQLAHPFDLVLYEWARAARRYS